MGRSKKGGPVRFEFWSGKKGRFWEIEVKGEEVITKYGSVGGKPRTSSKSYPHPMLAEYAAEDLKKKKIEEGYQILRTDREVLCASHQKTIEGLLNADEVDMTSLGEAIKEAKRSKCKIENEDKKSFWVSSVISDDGLECTVAIEIVKLLQGIGISRKILKESFIDHFGFHAASYTEDYEMPVHANLKLLPHLIDVFGFDKELSISLNVYIFHVTLAVDKRLDVAYVGQLLRIGADPNYKSKGYRGGRDYRGYTSSPVEMVGKLFAQRGEEAIMKMLLEHGGRIEDAVREGADPAALAKLAAL